ncbi:hypothetical protein HWV62_30193 [Athelia sp. TMB]|nr:hypothetical protein HWV62_30193 [Athelia sp. TMB]
MSYPSYPYHEGGYSSMPTTPRTPYPWDLQEQDASPYQQPQDQQQQQQAPQQQEPPQQMQMQPPQDAYDPPAPPHPPLQMIQLEERPPPAARRASAEHERPDGPHAHAHKPRIRVDTRATSPAAKGFHPYRRPDSGRREAHVRFAAGQPQGSMSAPSVPGPSRASLGSTSTSSPLARSFTPLPPSPLPTPAPAAPAHKLLIRTDIAYAAGTLTAHLELPGLARGDVRVALGTCAYNRVRQLVVSGRALPPANGEGEGACVVRERRYGEFRRVLAVPPDTKPGDVEAEMAHGVLVLRIAVGPPAEAPEEEIAVR